MLQTVNEAFSRDAWYHGTRGDWYIVIARTRDADLLERSNWYTCVKQFNMSDAVDKLDVAIERAGHWAVGWVEYLIISPNNLNYIAMAETIEKRLSDYPVLDDDDYSARQWEEAQDYFEEAKKDYKNRHGKAFPRRLFDTAIDTALDHESYISVYDLETIVKENRAERRVPNTITVNGKRYVCRIWDNGGDTMDRYTVAFKGYRVNGRMIYPYLFSGTDPKGMSGHGENSSYLSGRGGYLGKRVSFESLPVAVQNLIKGEFQ